MHIYIRIIFIVIIITSNFLIIFIMLYHHKKCGDIVLALVTLSLYIHIDKRINMF